MPTCQWELWGDDMYPEFAPEPIRYEACERPATHMCTSVWAPALHQLACEEHATQFDAAETTIVPMPEHYGRGYDLGMTEAALVVLTENEVAWLTHEDELPERLEPRSVLDGQWAGESMNELDLTVETATDYQLGYEHGWRYQLYSTAAERYQAAVEEVERENRRPQERYI